MSTNKGRFWAWAGILAVTAIWLASAGANFWAGYSLTTDPFLRLVSGSVSVAVDILKVVTLFAIVAAVANRRWVAMGVAIVVLAICSTWSMRNAVYTASVVFGTANAEREHQAQATANLSALLAIKQERAKFLAGQKVTIDASKTRRSVVELAADENKRSAAEFGAMIREIETDNEKFKAAPVSIPRDPIAWMLDIDPKYAVTGTAFFFAFLVEFASGFGFWMIAQARTPKGPQREARKSQTERAIDPPTGTVQQVIESKGNVVALQPRGRSANPGRVLAEALADVVEVGNPQERVLRSVVMQRVMARVPRGFEYIQPQHLALAAMDLGLDKPRKIGGQMYFYGARLKSGAAIPLESQQSRAM